MDDHHFLKQEHNFSFSYQNRVRNSSTCPEGLSVPPFLRARSPLWDQVSPIFRTYMDPAEIYVRSSKSSMFSLRNSCQGRLVSAKIMKFKEITTWQELATQGRCFVRTSGTLTTRTFILHIHNSRGILCPWSQGWPSIWLQLPDLPNSCGQSSSGSFAMGAVSIRGTEIHPAGAFLMETSYYTEVQLMRA